MDVKKKAEKKSPPKQQKEKLSREDIMELMGVNKQILTKKNGAWRRK